MTNNKISNLKKFVKGILIIYVIYPVIYYYSFYIRHDYFFINNLDVIVYILWGISGLLSLACTIYAILLKKNSVADINIANKQVVIIPIYSIILFLLFIVYSYILTFIDYILN